MTTATTQKPSVESLQISKEIEIAAPIEIAFQAVLDQLGPEGEMPGGRPFPMKLELWPGGRWYRDLGDNAGHLWGHLQVVKPPTLLEICGPLMMSYPAANHLQYRLTADGDVTRLALLHRAIGLFEDQHRDGLSQGWQYWLERIRKLAEAPRKESSR